jgi:hypothetical protein
LHAEWENQVACVLHDEVLRIRNTNRPHVSRRVWFDGADRKISKNITVIPFCVEKRSCPIVHGPTGGFGQLMGFPLNAWLATTPAALSTIHHAAIVAMFVAETLIAIFFQYLRSRRLAYSTAAVRFDPSRIAGRQRPQLSAGRSL